MLFSIFIFLVLICINWYFSPIAVKMHLPVPPYFLLFLSNVVSYLLLQFVWVWETYSLQLFFRDDFLWEIAVKSWTDPSWIHRKELPGRVLNRRANDTIIYNRGSAILFGVFLRFKIAYPRL